MNKKIMVIGIVLLILMSFAFVKYKNARNAPVDETQNLCVSVPAEHKSQCEQLNAWLDQKIVEWKPAEYKSMGFGAYHLFASDDQFAKTNAKTDTKFLGMLEDTGAGTVILYIRPKEYFSQKSRYDSIINKIKADGKKLFIGARFDDGSMDFAAYDKALTDYTRNIIAAIKPDYFGIVMEPATMEKRYAFDATDEQWADLSDRTAILSKQLSPATKTVVDGHKEELKFLELASGFGSIDVIGFNIYDSSGIYDGYSGYLGKGDVVGKTIDYSNSKGKEAWILETWVTDCSASKEKQAICASNPMKSIDVKWVKVITYYAQKHNVKLISPFFTGKFVYYGTNPAEFESALEGGQRTPVFSEFKNLVSEFG